MVGLMPLPVFKFIYGPVHSWRIGMSLGIDPLNTTSKHCNFECAYCQLGMAAPVSSQRAFFVSEEAVLDEVRALPADVQIDYFTFSGNGEPTLATNLGRIIEALKASFPAIKVAVITNATTIGRLDVQADLLKADLVLFKIEAATQAVFEKINRPVKGIFLKDIIAGIKAFKVLYGGKLALQIMLTDINKAEVADLARIARDIAPDEVQLNTPLRPSPVKPLDEAEMARLKVYFTAESLNVLSVYEEEKKEYTPFDALSTRKRHGVYDHEAPA